MREVAWVAGLVMLAFAWTVVGFLPALPLIETAQALMLGCAALGIPLELAYFVALGIALGSRPDPAPDGWYWRPFHHHHLLSRGSRRLVLPFYYTGALAFTGMLLGMSGVLLGMLAGWRSLA